jgi:penicillin-binding protein 2
VSLIRNDSREPRRLRYTRAVAIVIAGVVALFIGVARLQIIDHSRYQNMAERNWVRLEILRAPRGRIFDRNGILLADNKPAFSIVFQPPPLGSSLPDTLSQDVRERLTEILAVPDSTIQDVTRQAVRRGLAMPLARDVPLEIVAAMEERSEEFPSVEVHLEPRRSYPESTLGAHFLGYAGEISGAELEELRERNYRQGDLIGRAGLERSYESTLRGRDGREIVVVNASGRRVQLFEEPDPIYPDPGQDLVLTLDLPLQQSLEEAMADVAHGAAVAIDPQSGGVLAMVSCPAFDPNEFAKGLSAARWNDLVADHSYPLLNRAVQSAYPPGSTYKVLVSLGALGDGTVREEDRIASCGGGLYYGGRYYRCWLSGGHGTMHLTPALTHSCDVYYYQLGLKMGVAPIARWARRFGLGSRTGIDLPSERGGLVPGPEWFDEHRGEGKWKRGVVLNLAIGQGEVLTTPLQLASMTATIATRGQLHTPHLVAAIRDPVSEKKTELPQPRARRIRLARQHWDSLIAAMEQVVAAGTGGRSRVPGLRVAGKTGTAQNPHGEDHALFIAYAPVEEPRIAIAVIVENSGHGGSVAAPIAQRAIASYLRAELPEAPVDPGSLATASQAERDSVTAEEN